MTVIRLHSNRGAIATPIVAFVDLQREYIAAGRAYSLAHIETCLDNCRRLLAACRELGLPIAHFRQIRNSPYFNQTCRFSQWIDGFRPQTNESVFERDLPSCYANPAFCSLLDSIARPTIVLVGFCGAHACLSTAVDAFHRNHRLIYVQDCSATVGFAGLSEADAHSFVSQLIAFYAEVTTLDDMVAQLTNFQPRLVRRPR